ncbi:MAG: GAF domain-containing protein [Magnetococcales bacterium]|nr:GAF domain-containing protein [Magnetococcales bacterium]
MLADPTSRKLLDIQLQLGATRDAQILPPLITQAAVELCNADRAALFALDWERMELCAQSATGVQGEIRLALRMGIVGLAFLRKEIINVVDAYNVPFFNQEIDRASGYKTETVLVAPITDGHDTVLGAIQLLNKRAGCFTQDDEERVAQEVREISSPAFFATLDAEQAKPLIDRLVRESGCDRGSFFVLNKTEGILTALYASGMTDKPAIGVRINLGIAGWVVSTGQTLVIEDAYQSTFFNAEIDHRTGYHTHSIVAVPLKASNGEPLGVLEIVNKRDGTSFTPSDVDALQALAAIAAIALENAILFQEHEAQFHSFIEVMAASLDARSPLTTGHSQLVSEYACGIAREMGLSDDDVDVVRVAALLHDYNKLDRADAALHKAGPLAHGEADPLHPSVPDPQPILKKMCFSRKYRYIPKIAAAHHGHMDGSGYGGGLLNRYIPFLAKIITVADIFETLTADHHYRKRMPAEEALAILRQGAGKKFDAAIIAAMEQYWQKRTGGVTMEPVQPLDDLPVTPLKTRPLLP